MAIFVVIFLLAIRQVLKFLVLCVQGSCGREAPAASGASSRRAPARLPVLYLTSPDFARLLGCLLIFLCDAKPSFEIAKWMAKNMLWQDMKINNIMQKT